MARPLSASAHQQRRADILAVLEEKPYSTTELAQLLGVRSGLHGVLSVLTREGLTKRIPGDRWMLAGGTEPEAPAPRPLQEASKRRDAIVTAAAIDFEADEDELVEELEPSDDVDVVEVDEAPEMFRRRPGRAPRKGLRQPHERPASVNLPVGAEPSWWVGASRQKFSEEARARHARMREAKENKFVPFRTLQ